MGFMDNLKKLTDNIGKEIKESGIQEDLSNFGKEFTDSMNELGKEAKDFFGNVNSGSKDVSGEEKTYNRTSTLQNIPEEFKDFPRFSKDYKSAEKRETEKYVRCSMKFEDVTDEEIQNYIDQITNAGYAKFTDVRFEKGNTYIIVDTNVGYGLNIVFHIKK